MKLLGGSPQHDKPRHHHFGDTEAEHGVRRIADVSAVIGEEISAMVGNTAQGPAGEAGARLRTEFAAKKLRLPELGKSDQEANRQYVKLFLLRPNKELGQTYSLEYAEQFHY